MILDFEQIEEQPMLHFKGGEGTVYAKMYYDGVNRIMLGRLPVGSTIGMHTHEQNSETAYIVSGTAIFITDGVKEVLTPGQVHHCPKGHTHTCLNGGDTDMIMLAVVPEHHE